MTRNSEPQLSAATQLRLGEMIAGKYLVESMLGAGGMGAVVRARHIQLDRPVAIKVMHRELLTMPDAPRRFALEARATAALKSQHAVRILDIDRLPSGSPYIVMELLEGIDLGTMIATRGPLPVDRAIHYLLQAAEAIGEAHNHGIIHRDLKPGNLFLSKEGIVKVLDFGLAKTLHPPAGTAPLSARTATNILIGSPNYMAPEQLWPGRDVDERTDIWGLGATLFQLLAGEPPFPAPSLHALMTRIATEDPARVADRRRDVTPTVDGVIARCMRKNPDERYRSISAFQGSLLHLRAELQSGPARDVNVQAGTYGATIPATTRRNPVEPDQASTLKPYAEPDPAVSDPGAGAEELPLVTAWEGDDEPTQISATEEEAAAPGGALGATRKA